MSENPADQLLAALTERAKELNCLYKVDEILSRQDVPAADVYRDLITTIPLGWQYPDICEVELSLDGETYKTDKFVDAPWNMSADIIVAATKVGELSVYYTDRRPNADEGPFLREERRLLSALAERLGLAVMQRQIRSDHRTWKRAVEGVSADHEHVWSVLLEFLQRTDPGLLIRITRKMINHLCWTGIREADQLLAVSLEEDGRVGRETVDENRPLKRRVPQDTAALTSKTFALAAEHISDADIVSRIQAWINEEKSTFLIKSLENPGTGLAEVSEAVERYESAAIEDTELPTAVQTSLRVALLRRFFVDQLDFINVAKRFVQVKDFYELASHLIYPSKSQGKLGGKGAGLFLAAQVVRKAGEVEPALSGVKVPKTWYVASDAILDFIQYNNLSEVYNRKYMEIEQIRQDHSSLVQLFKNSRFPPEIRKGLAVALDDFGDRPLIVRSSSLLEDQAGAAFSGKYKSLFLANQGGKRERLEALQDAIAEIYASVFAPDPIEYRAERGLLDFREEMAVLIQEVVGRHIGKYFFPPLSGVAFSRNEFRWSPRIKREDGLVRLVFGLGTRAVDRLSDDYPVLVAPGQPGLRANVTADEIVAYAPRKADVINLESNAFETVEIEHLLRESGDAVPKVRSLVSIVEKDRIRKPHGLEPDWEKDDVVVTFEGLLTDTPFMSQMKALLETLHDKLGVPVDIEFAFDGDDLYLLQCRAQSYSEEHAPAPIPRDLPEEKAVFSANRHISNGRVPDITHVVFVDPEGYANLGTLEELKDVARAVGMLNKLLPKRQFILMGPGRWGSRGDIKLGVGVTYSDINNTAVLIEIAQKRGNYLPEPSFGTHFFQDLVEAHIRYIPLYPDDPNVTFNEPFLRHSSNLLRELLPAFQHLESTVRVIDVAHETGGEVLRVLMNADLDEAVGLLGKPSALNEVNAGEVVVPESSATEYWRLRLRMAEEIAAELDPHRFGVKALYVFGSTKNATAGPASDIDLLVHLEGDDHERPELVAWFEGWSLSLATMNYLRTGYRTDGLLDVHYVTDQDIADRTSFAVKIGAVTDAARRLQLGRKPDTRPNE